MPLLKATVPSFPKGTTSAKAYLSDSEDGLFTSSVNTEVTQDKLDIQIQYAPFDTDSHYLYFGVEYTGPSGVVRTPPHPLRNDLLDDYFNAAGLVSPFRNGSAAKGVLYEDNLGIMLPSSPRANAYISSIIASKTTYNITTSGNPDKSISMMFYRGQPMLFMESNSFISGVVPSALIGILKDLEDIFDNLSISECLAHGGYIWRPKVMRLETILGLSQISEFSIYSEGTSHRNSPSYPLFSIDEDDNFWWISSSNGIRTKYSPSSSTTSFSRFPFTMIPVSE